MSFEPDGRPHVVWGRIPLGGFTWLDRDTTWIMADGIPVLYSGDQLLDPMPGRTLYPGMADFALQVGSSKGILSMAGYYNPQPNYELLNVLTGDRLTSSPLIPKLADLGLIYNILVNSRSAASASAVSSAQVTSGSAVPIYRLPSIPGSHR